MVSTFLMKREAKPLATKSERWKDLRGLREKRENLLEDYCRRCIRLRTIPQIIHKTDLKKKRREREMFCFKMREEEQEFCPFHFFPLPQSNFQALKHAHYGKCSWLLNRDWAVSCCHCVCICVHSCQPLLGLTYVAWLKSPITLLSLFPKILSLKFLFSLWRHIEFPVKNQILLEDLLTCET